MSDVMFFGVLRMPYNMAMSDELSRYQFWSRAQDACDRIERSEALLRRALSRIELELADYPRSPHTSTLIRDIREVLGEKDD